MPKLTDKQQAFCEEYIVDLNATQAAIRAGYSEASARQIASDLLSKHDIQEQIQKHQDERSERVQVDADYVLKGLLDLHKICSGEKEVTITDKEGGLSTTKVFEPAGANKALENLGKHLKLFTDKQEVSGPDGSAIKTESTFNFLPVNNNNADKH